MGYSTDMRGRLACDNCGNSGGVRRRRCRFKVTTHNARSVDGERHTLDYCPAPALCADCYRTLGGARGVHSDERCGAGARASQAEHDAKQARLDAGEAMVTSAVRDPDDRFYTLVDATDGRTYRVLAEEYAGGGFIADYDTAVPA